MSDVSHQGAIPSLPAASLDLINTSIQPVDRFATPNLAIGRMIKKHAYFLAFLLPFLIVSYAYLLLPSRNESLVNTLSRDEMEYVRFLQSGHESRLHLLREVLFGLALLSISASLCAKFKLWTHPLSTQIAVSGALALICSMGMIQIGRIHSVEATYYALEHQKNPDAMISASEKIAAVSLMPKKETIVTLLFSRKLPLDATATIAHSYRIRSTPIPLRSR